MDPVKKKGKAKAKTLGTGPDEEAQYNVARERFLEKPLPGSEESERVILGAILLDNNLFDEVASSLSFEDFYSPRHKRIFEAMQELSEAGRKIDPIFLGEVLKKENLLESIGGVATITNLTYGLPYLSGVEEYTKVVKDKAQIRDLIRRCNSIIMEATSEEYEVSELLDMAEQSILQLDQDDPAADNFKSVASVADAVIDRAQKIAHGEMDAVGLLTGFVDLDAMTQGLQPTDLIIIAGRPSMGKTTLGVDIGRHVAYGQEKTVAMFSLEMSEEQLTSRILCSEGNLKGQRLRAATLTEDEWGRLHEARARVNLGRFVIDDTPALTSATLRRKARRLKRRLEAEGRKLDLVIVDYLQLMDGEGDEGRQQEVTKISRELKKLAKELHCPVIALSQLSRQPEGRTANKHRPILSDLRESGAIEQDADVVAFIYREEMYPNADGTIAGVGEGEIIVAKQRNGPTGTVLLTFIKESTKFENHVAEY